MVDGTLRDYPHDYPIRVVTTYPAWRHTVSINGGTSLDAN